MDTNREERLELYFQHYKKYKDPVNLREFFDTWLVYPTIIGGLIITIPPIFNFLNHSVFYDRPFLNLTLAFIAMCVLVIPMAKLISKMLDLLQPYEDKRVKKYNDSIRPENEKLWDSLGLNKEE